MLEKKKWKAVAVVAGALTCGLAIAAAAFCMCGNVDWQTSQMTMNESAQSAYRKAPPPDITHSDFDDAWFADYCFGKFDTNGDNKLSGTERMNVKEISFSNDNNIMSLADLKLFPALETVEISWCANLEKVDVTGCTSLKNFTLKCCKHIAFTNIDLSTCVSLEMVDVAYNNNVAALLLPPAPSKIKYLDYSYTKINLDDFSAYTALEELHCAGSQAWSIVTPPSLIILDCSYAENVFAIDSSASPNLKKLYANSCDMVYIDLKDNPKLEVLWLGCNSSLALYQIKNIDCCEYLSELDLEDLQGTFLDLSGNPNLTYVSVGDCAELATLSLPTKINGVNNTLETLVCSYTAITSLDVSAYHALKELYCIECNDLKTLTLVAPGETNTSLEQIRCSGAGIEGYLDLCSLEALKWAHFDCMPNLTSINASCNQKLEFLNAMECDKLSYIGVSSCPNFVTLNADWCAKLRTVYVTECALTKLELSNCPELETVVCRDNVIETLTLPSSSYKMTSIDCGNNALTSLDVSGFPKLEALSCYNNKITALDVTANTYLRYLDCSGNNIGNIDLSQNYSLDFIAVANCGLSSLDISSLSLAFLECSNNNFGSIDSALQGQTSLQTLICCNCGLSSLDLANVPDLGYLECANNNLTELDLSPAIYMTYLDCSNNKLTTLNMDDNPNLEVIMCQDNQLTELNLGTRDSLRIVECQGNNMAELYIGGCLDLCSTVSIHPPVNNGSYYSSSYEDSWYIRHAVCYDLTTYLTKVRYTVSFDANGGYGTMPAQAIGEGMSYVLPDCAFAVPEGMEFAGWNLGAPGTSIVITENTVVKATWKSAARAITVTTNGNGTASASMASALNGATVSLTATADYGFVFQEWQVISGGVTIADAKSTSTSFVMGTDNVEIKAIFREATFEDFIERMYVVALNRESEPDGKAFWMDQVKNNGFTGGRVAIGFLIEAPEFLNRGLTNEQFVDVLYKTFFDREADEGGKAFWMGHLTTDMTREQVVRGFIDSTEWCNLCAMYGVKSGAPNAKAEKPSRNALKFATRLYTECLGRDPDADGLQFWALRLTNLESSGYEAAKGFFESEEFTNKNVDDTTYVKLLYRTFMGRDYDQSGLEFWLGHLSTDMNRLQVLQGFAQSQEFTNICNEYGIDRGTI